MTRAGAALENGLRGLICLLCVLAVLCLGAAAPGLAQTAAPPAVTSGDATLDYAQWERLAGNAEGLISRSVTTSGTLEERRAVVAQWRERFLAAQGTNSTRIATLRDQIAALGSAPAEGETEDEGIAARRGDLTEQLARLQAPGIAAVEAYSRADGLIREIDRILRERQADELLRLSPAPINPANWPAALLALKTSGETLWAEVARNIADARRRDAMVNAAPMIVGLLLLSALLILRGRGWIEGFALGLHERASSRGRAIWAFLASLGQIVAPTVGVWAAAVALMATQIAGDLGQSLIGVLIPVGFTLFTARWLGGQVFPKAMAVASPLGTSPERRGEGRFLATVLGLIIGAEALRTTAFPAAQTPDAALSVLAFPTIVLGALFLFRLGQLLIPPVQPDAAGEKSAFSLRLIALIGRGALIVAVVAPVLAAIGYVAAGEALVFPAIVSLALTGLIFVLQRLVIDIYGLVTRSEETAREALMPALIGFVLILVALPLFALIWGARLDDITELLNRIREGFQIGATRISPESFLVLMLVFAAGFLVTRLFQGALKTSILPKTSLDQGGRNAIVAGVGYLGIFLSGLVGITAAGIDLSGLAIVAGALSLGIGFGMQNIVSNFVAGIILLIERPVSEGDLIEVGGVQGVVQTISVRSTRIQTFDRTDVIVPNADLVSGVVTNLTRANLTGRLIVKVGVAYGTDTRKVEAILRSIAEAQPLAVMNPPPLVLLMGFGADSVDFEVRVILRDVNFISQVRSDMNHEIVRLFAEAGVEIPFAQRDIWLRNPEVLRPAPAVAPQSDADADADADAVGGAVGAAQLRDAGPRSPVAETVAGAPPPSRTMQINNNPDDDDQENPV